MRLIDGDELIKNTILNPCHAPYITKQDVDNAPIVCVPQNIPLRCRTCSFFVSKDCVTYECSMFGGKRTADDYCSKGAWTSNAAD